MVVIKDESLHCGGESASGDSVGRDQITSSNRSFSACLLFTGKVQKNKTTLHSSAENLMID